MWLTAVIEIPAGQADAQSFLVKLRITNPTDRRIAILNPDMGVPSPAVNWPYSKEAYQTFLLLSFGFLSLLVTDEAGKEVPRQESFRSATPALRPPLELGPGDLIELVIPIGNFYQLESGKAYRIALEYGDQNLKVSAQTRVMVP